MIVVKGEELDNGLQSLPKEQSTRRWECVCVFTACSKEIPEMLGFHSGMTNRDGFLAGIV